MAQNHEFWTPGSKNVTTHKNGLFEGCPKMGSFLETLFEHYFQKSSVVLGETIPVLEPGVSKSDSLFDPFLDPLILQQTKVVPLPPYPKIWGVPQKWVIFGPFLATF